MILCRALLLLFSTAYLHPAHVVDFIVKATTGDKSPELIILDKEFTLDLILTDTHGRFL